jgi:hypothetical protein
MTDPSENATTHEPILELDEPREPSNGHAEAHAKTSRAKRIAAQAPTDAPPPSSIFDRLADNLRELEEKEESLRADLGNILEAKAELRSKLGGELDLEDVRLTVVDKKVAKRLAAAMPPALGLSVGARYERPTIGKRFVEPVKRKLARTVKKAVADAARAAIHSASAASPKPRKRSGAKRHRRSHAELAKGVEAVVAFVAKHKKGVGAEQIREALKMPKAEWPQLIAMALDAKKVSKRGEKRATVYTKAK